MAFVRKDELPRVPILICNFRSSPTQKRRLFGHNYLDSSRDTSMLPSIKRDAHEGNTAFVRVANTSPENPTKP
jgi:hypothetical protein